MAKNTVGFNNSDARNQTSCSWLLQSRLKSVFSDDLSWHLLLSTSFPSRCSGLHSCEDTSAPELHGRRSKWALAVTPTTRPLDAHASRRVLISSLLDLVAACACSRNSADIHCNCDLKFIWPFERTMINCSHKRKRWTIYLAAVIEIRISCHPLLIIFSKLLKYMSG